MVPKTFHLPFSVKVDIDDKVFSDAMVFPNKVILRVVAHLDAVVCHDFKVIGTIVS